MSVFGVPLSRRVWWGRSLPTLAFAVSFVVGGAWAPSTQAQHTTERLTAKEPVPWRVYQRDEKGKADVPVVLDEELGAHETVRARVLGSGLPETESVVFRDGKLLGVPTGGPYQVLISVEDSESHRSRQVHIPSIFVGDLWVLAGQSNMQGVGNLEDVTPPSSRVAALGMDGKWVQAVEPLHWLVDSPDPVHSGKAEDREARSRAEHQNRTKGAGLGLPFAVALTRATNVPIGLVVCAHGGTSMAQWSPDRKDEGGGSLYGSMLRQIKLAGGKVRGILWYQGESDANPPADSKFAEVFPSFIAAVRADLEQPELPFYYVQIGRFVAPREPEGWNVVRDVQRLVPDRVPNTAVVAAIDLELDDLIHVGTGGLKRLGGRLARIAERELFGLPGGTTPTLERVAKRADNTLVLKFKGVNRRSAEAPADPARAAADARRPREGAGQTASTVVSPVGGLRPARHVAGFSIRKADGSEIPLIYDAAVGPLKDTVVLKLTGPIPEGAKLWYGYGLDPYCNLVDALDMAVPAFGPIALDELK